MKRAMATVARAMAMVTRVAGEQQQQGLLQRGWRVNNADKGGGNGNRATTWAMATVTRLAGDKEGKGEGCKEGCKGNEGGGRQRE